MKHIAFILVSFILVSCIDYYKIKTKVNADGSITRIFEVKGDSASIFNGKIKVPTDSTWSITYKWSYKDKSDSSSEKTLTYIAEKTFSTVDELNTELFVPKDSLFMTRVSASLENKFRWFFSVIRYSETYSKKFPFHYFPIEDFVSDYEYSLFTGDEYIYVPEKDSLVLIKNLDKLPVLNSADSARGKELYEAINQKYIKWIKRNVYEGYFNLVLACATPDKQALLEQNKTSLFEATDIQDIFQISFGDNTFRSTLDTAGLTPDEITRLKPKESKLYEKKLEVIEEAFNSEQLYNQIELPGLLLNTNADSISNGKCHWGFETIAYYPQDFSMYAESRVFNRWVMVATIAIIAVCIVLLFYFKPKR